MNTRLVWLLQLAGAISTATLAHAQGSAFTYQGRLNVNGAPANGTYDFRYRLALDPYGNNYFGSPILPNGQVVSNGLFTATLDFGAVAFGGANYWLEVDVRTNGAPYYTSLNPLQPVTPTPYAIFSGTASNALNATMATTATAVGVNGVNAFAILDRAVSSSKIADSSVTSAKIADGAVTTAKMADGAVTTAKLGGGAVVKSLTAGANTLYDDVTLAAGNNVTISQVGQTVTIAETASGWSLAGNGGTTAGANFIGTTDSQPVEIRVNGQRALRLQPGNTPNIIAGRDNNSIAPGIAGGAIGGGSANSIVSAANGSVIGGGYANTNQDSAEYCVIAGGQYNRIAGSAYYSVIPGGSGNTITGRNSFAGGTYATANHSGCFVWGDFSSTTATTANNQFMARCTGGAVFYTSGGTSTGVKVDAGGTSWTTICDRNAKKNFQPVDSVAVLDKLATIPVQQWNYKWEKDTDVPNIGPMAQDFKQAFYPGRDDKGISTLEFDGVELAAIQGLNKKLQEKDAEIQALKARLDRLERALSSSTGSR